MFVLLLGEFIRISGGEIGISAAREQDNTIFYHYIELVLKI